MTLGKLGRWLYRAARLLGDADAVRRGRYGRRIVRRAEYRAAWRLIGRMRL